MEGLVTVGEHAGIVLLHGRRLETVAQGVAVALDLAVVFGEIISTEFEVRSDLDEQEEEKDKG